MGATARAFHVYRTSFIGAGTHLPRRPRDLHGSREGSFGDAGCGTLEQRDRRSVGNRRADGKSPCRKTDAQSWGTKPDCAFGARYHAFAGDDEVAQPELVNQMN